MEKIRKKARMDEKAIYDKGLDVGEKQGEEKEKVKIAKNMLELEIDIETIAKATGLAKEEIEKFEVETKKKEHRKY